MTNISKKSRFPRRFSPSGYPGSQAQQIKTFCLPIPKTKLCSSSSYSLPNFYDVKMMCGQWVVSTDKLFCTNNFFARFEYRHEVQMSLDPLYCEQIMGIGSSCNFLGKHSRGGSSKTNEETADCERGSGVHKTDACGWDSSSHKHTRTVSEVGILSGSMGRGGGCDPPRWPRWGSGRLGCRFTATLLKSDFYFFISMEFFHNQALVEELKFKLNYSVFQTQKISFFSWLSLIHDSFLFSWAFEVLTGLSPLGCMSSSADTAFAFGVGSWMIYRAPL